MLQLLTAIDYVYVIAFTVTLLFVFACTHPFSENEISVIGPECPGNLATLAPSFRSQILITLECEQEKKINENKLQSDKLSKLIKTLEPFNCKCQEEWHF